MRLVVLDFDGVICDSAEECFVSSWTAYHALHRGREAGEAPPKAREAFRALRPFVRSGEDFVLIQDLAAAGKTVKSQSEFDRAWDRPGVPPREMFKDLYYKARTDLMEKDRRAWLSLNRVYPHVKRAFARRSAVEPLYILSTKKPFFVRETLSANGIDIPDGNVLYSEGEPKLAAVEKLRASLGCDEAVFVEDQIDAIRGNANPRIRVYLASWGYIQESWLREHTGIPVLGPEDFVELLAAAPG
jgi:phosphoglycolate phosphatase-like HAD superfamily hydrolase